MNYNIVIHSAEVFYKLANELRYEDIKELIPNKNNCLESQNSINICLNIINDIVKYLPNIIEILDNYISDNGPTFNDELKNLFQIMFKFMLKLLSATNYFLQALSSIKILDDIGIDINIINFNGLDDYFQKPNIVFWAKTWVTKLKTAIPHLQKLSEIIPLLHEGEEGIVEDWQDIKLESLIVIKLFDNLLYNLNIDNAEFLLNLDSIIEHKIDKITSIYEPSDEEQARALLPIEDQDDPEAIKRVLEGGYF